MNGWSLLRAIVGLLLIGAQSSALASEPMTTLHYAPNGTFNAMGVYAPGAAGFNLADVSSVADLNALPAGVEGLVWIGLGTVADVNFISVVQPFIGNPKLFGFYLVDEPDPSLVPASNLKSESDWIHAHVPGARTFIVLMNLGPDTSPTFDGSYKPSNTDIDLFGVDPYPVQTAFGGPDYSIINASVAAAEAWGVPQSAIVPVYQAFGGGGYASWILPTAAQEQQILATWGSLIPTPVFDVAYSWGSQNGDTALENDPPLQSVFLTHNTLGASSAPSITSSLTATGTMGSGFSYQITATQAPTSFGATALPSWATMDASGLITGTPTVAAVTTVTISATNANGTGTASLTISVSALAAPVVTSAATATGTVGSAFSYQISAANAPTSFGATGLPSWASVSATGLITGTPTATGSTSATMVATNASGAGSGALTIIIAAPGGGNGGNGSGYGAGHGHCGMGSLAALVALSGIMFLRRLRD